MAFAHMMASPFGRFIRIVAGGALALIGTWIAFAGGSVGMIWVGIAVGMVGVLVVYAGAVNVCFIAPLIGAPFKGRDARR